MDGYDIFLIYFLLSIPVGIFTGVVADSKNHSLLGWIVLGFLFGPLAFFSAIGLGEKRERIMYMERIAPTMREGL